MSSLPVNSVNERLIDVSQRPDMAEIMTATDCIITDYSTVIFEGFLTGQPGFIYADDFEEYVKDRGKLMFLPGEIPFSIARTNDELMQNIMEFEENEYRNNFKLFTEERGIVEDGNATRRLVNRLEEMIF